LPWSRPPSPTFCINYCNCIPVFLFSTLAPNVNSQ
jgi:hypothetical protein